MGGSLWTSKNPIFSVEDAGIITAEQYDVMIRVSEQVNADARLTRGAGNTSYSPTQALLGNGNFHIQMNTI